MKKIGTKARIGAIDYRVIEVTDTPNNYEGQVDYRANTIALLRGPTDSCKYNTFWHETFHTVLNDAGHLAEGSNEVIVSALAQGVTQVLRDNAWVRRFYEKEGR